MTYFPAGGLKGPVVNATAFPRRSAAALMIAGSRVQGMGPPWASAINRGSSAGAHSKAPLGGRRGEHKPALGRRKED